MAKDEMLRLAERVEAYDPRLSPDNRADELELHRDVVIATGLGSMNPEFGQTFVRSLDVAMSLVPEGWNWMAGNRNHPTARAYVNNGEPHSLGISGMRPNPKLQWHEVVAVTPALALTAAALRARSMEG